MTTSIMRPPNRVRAKEPSNAKLDEMIKEAIVDAYDESEQLVGFYNMLEDNLTTPFKGVNKRDQNSRRRVQPMLGVEVTVERIDMTDDERIVAACARGKSRQLVSLLDLPLPTPPPEGADWIAAFRRWARGGR